MAVEAESSSLFARYCEISSLHGFIDWYKASSIVWRIVWTVAIVGCFIASVYELYTSFRGYQDSPLITSYNMLSKSAIEFPAVQICTQNFIDQSRVVNESDVKILNAMLNMLNNAGKKTALNAIPNLEALIYYNYTLSNVSERIDALEMFERLGFDAADVLKVCHYSVGFINCSDPNFFQQVFDGQYGNCFLFGTKEPQVTSSFGLTLLIDLRSNDTWSFNPEVSEGLLVRITEKPNPVHYSGLLIPPGYHARIGLRTTRYELDSTGGKSCQHEMERKVFSYDVPYSDDLCRSDCYYKSLEATCNCIPLMSKRYLQNQTSWPCQTLPELYCRHVEWNNSTFQKEFETCSESCLPACHYVDYNPILSLNRFPSKRLRELLGSADAVSDLYRRPQDFILLEIAHSTMQEMHLTQSPSLTPDAVLGQIGGQLGLFLGASVLSIIQPIVMLLEAGAQKLCTKKSPIQTKGNSYNFGK